MTDDQDQTFPLAGSSLVRGGRFEAEFKWFTVGNVAFVKHAIHSRNDLSSQDVNAFGQTLTQVADSLAEQGVSIRYGVEHPLNQPVDPVGEAVAEEAGLVPTTPALVLRRRTPIAPDDPIRKADGPVGRPIRGAVADSDAWTSLVWSPAAFPAPKAGEALVLDENDHVSTVESGAGSGLVACCWARVLLSPLPGAPKTAEIVAVGVERSLDGAASDAARRAAVLAIADLVSSDGVRTLAACVDDDDRELVGILEALGFVARRGRQYYARP